MEPYLFEWRFYCPNCNERFGTKLEALECCFEVESELVFSCTNCLKEFENKHEAVACCKIEKDINNGKQKTLI